MSAYIFTAVEGNKSFGGYLSIDGGKFQRIEDEMNYELSPGHHAITISSSSGSQKNLGKLQSSLSSSSGGIIDAINRNNAINNLGDEWEINVYIEDHQMLALNILTKGQKILNAPIYKVLDLEQEDIERLENMFEEWRNTPIRSKKKMIAGAICIFCGIAPILDSSSNLDTSIIGVSIGFIVIGVLLFIFGFRKKIRRK